MGQKITVIVCNYRASVHICYANATRRQTFKQGKATVICHVSSNIAIIIGYFWDPTIKLITRTLSACFTIFSYTQFAQWGLANYKSE